MRTSLIALAALAVSLAFPAGAGALIQVDRGIAGVRLENTRAEVRAALGPPASTRSGSNEFGEFVQYRYRGGIRVLFLRNRVSLVGTTGLGDRTNSGIGVGSSEQRVRNRIPGIDCETFGSTRICSRGAEQPGERGTFFFIRQGRVTRAEVALLID